MRNVNKLIEVFRKKNLPIVMVNVNPADAAWTKTRKEAKPMRPPNMDDWFKITDKINSAENDIRITKHTWSAFYETELDNELKNAE